MINFASLFSQFRNNTSSAINDLLDNQSTNIDRLLDQDSFPNQYKSANSKVMEYMKYNRYEELVKYITEVGPADDKKKGYKFPLIASDILSSDNSTTIEFFFPQSDIIVEEIKDVLKQVEVLVEVDENDEEQVVKAEAVVQEPKTVIQDQLQGSEDTVITEIEIQKPEQETTKEEQAKQIEEKQKPQESQEPQEPKPEKKTKIVKKMETVQEVQKKKKQPLINKLFAYFEGEVNYTLAGYVSKTLIAFYNKKSIPVMTYLLDGNRIQSLLNHIESRSVGELLTKIMTHQSNDLLDERKSAFQRTLARLSIGSEIFVMSNLSVCVSEIIEKVATNLKSQSPITQFSKIFFTPSVITKVITNVMADEENISVYNAPVLLTYLTNVPLNIPDDKELVEQFKTLLKNFLDKALGKLRITKVDRSALGVGRIKIIEIISFILKSDILDFRTIVGDNRQLFKILFTLCRNYQMNNILHNQMMKMIELAISLDSTAPSSFLLALINDDLLLNFIIQEAKEDAKIRSGEAQRKSRKGYIGHIITLCQKLMEQSTNNQIIKTLCERQQFVKVMEELVDKEVYEQRKTLAGYTLRKNAGQSIMFVKEDVIQAHFKFLAACPTPVFEPEPDSVNIEHPDLQSTHAVSIQNPAEAIEAILAQEKQNAENFESNPKYWVNHLHYDIDELMNDL